MTGVDFVNETWAVVLPPRFQASSFSHALNPVCLKYISPGNLCQRSL